MKKILLLTTLFLSYFSNAQDIIMQNGTFNQCSAGFFYDSGGEFGPAGNNENFTLTLCPDSPGFQAQVDFITFQLQANLDFLTIYNGPDATYDEIGTFTAVNSPGLITASLTEINPGGQANPDGCLTFVYTSNADGPSAGWQAEISCFEPCQSIDAVLVSTTPATNAEDIIRICQGDQVTFEGDGVFGADPTGATYTWDFGDGTSDIGQTVTKTYDNEGIYIVNLAVGDDNPAGCSSTNLINQFVHVSTNPDFSGSAPAQATICYGEQVDIVGQVQGVTFAIDCANGGVQANLGSAGGATYNSELDLDCFLGQQITDPTQLESICIVMEHTYIGDLEIIVISPSGQQVTLHNQTGGGTFVGDPIISDGTGPGVGWEYCFAMSGTQILSNGPTIPGGTPTPGNSVDPDAGPFLPIGDFANFVGSDINGTWTLFIEDHLNIDDGTIFTWSLNFDESLLVSDFAFTPIIDNEGWIADPTIVATTGNVITVAPPDAGTYTYTYTAEDDFGCTYTQDVSVEVLPELITETPNPLVICNPGAPPYIFDLELNTPVVTASAPNAGDLVVTYHNSQVDAENDVNAIAPSNTYSGADGETVYVRVEYLDSGCFGWYPFTVSLSDPPVINNVPDISVCDDGLNDGIELFNLESQTIDILGAQDPASYEVTYHDSEADAIADIDALVSPYPNTSSPQGIWVRVETIGDATCFSVSPTAWFDIIVLPREDATFSMTPTCDGATVDLPLVTPGGIFEFTAFPGPGVNIDPATGEVTGATSGLPYEVQYTTPGLCSSTSVVTFTVLTQDDASFDVSEGCDGGTMNITGTAGGTFSFNPVPMDTAVIDPNTGEVTMATPGATYTIEYTTNGACPATNTELLVVNALDDPSFDLIATCDGATTDNIATPGGTFTFNPDPADGAVLDANTGTITNGISGSTYSVEYTTNGVCPQSLIQSVTVTAEDNATFTVAPTCDGGIATLDPAATVGGVFSFDIAPADAAVIDPATGEVTGGTPSTTYTITYTTTGVCATASTVSFTSDPIDDASFTVDPTCDGGIAVFGATTTLGGTFSFDTAPTDTAVIDPNTGLVSNGTPGETYSIEYVTNGICPNSSVVSFAANPLPVVVPPTALEVCDDAVPDGLTSIDLSLKDSEITGNNASYSVSYHPTQQDAIDGTNAHPIPYDNIANPETVYIRVVDTTTGCFDATQTLELVVEQAPVPLTATPDALRYCDPDSDGFGFFTLTDSEAQITGGDPGLTVTYHETLVNAEFNADPIDTSTAYANINEDMQTVYVRLESTTIATDCYTIVLLDLIVEPTPQLVVPEDLEACDDISADGLAEFDLTSVEDEVLDGQDPTDLVFSYYEDPMNAEDGINAIASPMAYTNTVVGGQPVWVRVDDTGTVAGCYKIVELQLIVNPLPVLTQPSELELCDAITLDDEQEGFILQLAEDEILSGQPGIALSYHPTQQDAIDGTGALTSPYTNTTNPQTIFVRGENSFGCVAYTTLTLRVLPIPTPRPSDEIPAMALCDATVVNDGLEVFDLTENEMFILNGETGVTPTYHTSEEDALAGENAIADETNYTNAGTGGPETIYVRVTNDTTGCFTVVNFTITVNPLPSVVAVTDFIQCELNTDGFDAFDLTTKDSEVLAGQDPLQFAVSYHTSLIDAEGGTNALTSPYTNTSNPQEIFVRITDNTTGCWIATQRFDIEVQEGAQANPDLEPILYEACDDNVEDDGDPSNDSVQFDLSTMNPQVLDLPDATGYTVTYFASEIDANLNVNPLPTLYENITNPQEIYVRVDNDILEVVSINLDLGGLTAPLDLDGDGTDDTIDTDGDGIFDLIDVDGDGISDATDTNGDGLIDFVDTDGDGMGDPLDLDGDGTFDNQQDSSICFAVASLTLQVNPLPVFDLDDAYILCINTNGTEALDPLVLDTGLSEADYSFEWTFDGNVIAGATGSSYMPLEEGTYGVTVTDTSTSTATACSISDTTEVMESEPPTLVVVNVTQVFAENHVIEATASGLGVYEYSLDGGPWQESGTFSGVSAGLHEVTARDRNGCGYVTESIFVVDYPRYFTPNGDGNHDTWNIAGIGGTAKIYIFDRYGKLLKQISPTGAGWDGTYNGNRMPSSDYWFTVEYDEPVSNQRRELRAHFTLKR